MLLSMFSFFITIIKLHIFSRSLISLTSLFELIEIWHLMPKMFIHYCRIHEDVCLNNEVHICLNNKLEAV